VVSRAQVRLVASDLDGTLLRSDGTVSERTRAALRATQEAGIRLLLVSARPPRWIRPAMDELGLDPADHPVAVCANGALVYDVAEEAIRAHTPLDGELVVHLVEALRARIPGVAFACEAELRYVKEPHYVPLWAVPEDYREADALTFGAVTKLILKHPELEQAHLVEVARELCGDAAFASFSGAELVEIAAAGVTKASAVADLCADLGVARGEVVAFGDMPNDVPLLEWAGHGVAVGNAHAEALAAADEVTAANDEDGVALVLERLHAA
jgi:Cof subfamily protein (haloacid dehalogenase superfamily)